MRNFPHFPTLVGDALATSLFGRSSGMLLHPGSRIAHPAVSTSPLCPLPGL